MPALPAFLRYATAFNDDSLLAIPTVQWRGQPFKVQVLWYPFEEWRVKAWIKAKNRREAIRALCRGGVSCRDLDDGRPTNQ